MYVNQSTVANTKTINLGYGVVNVLCTSVMKILETNYPRTCTPRVLDQMSTQAQNCLYVH